VENNKKFRFAAADEVDKLFLKNRRFSGEKR
jgi:hypothetical protein